MSVPFLKSDAVFPGETRSTLWLPTSEGESIGATLHRPEMKGTQGAKAVLLIPGWSGPRSGPAELLVALARELTSQGHVVLRIDLHGRGDSTGRFEDADLDRMIADASAGLDYLKQTCPGLPLVVGGICSGGNVALGVVSLRPEECAGAVGLSVLPYQPSRGADLERRRRWKNVKQYAAKALKPETWKKVLRGEVNMDRVKKNVAGNERKGPQERNLKDSSRDIEQELQGYKGNVQLIWGRGDEEAALARKHFEQLHQDGFGRRGATRFLTIEGANHNFYGEVWRRELIEAVQAFVSSV